MHFVLNKFRICDNLMTPGAGGLSVKYMKYEAFNKIMIVGNAGFPLGISGDSQYPSCRDDL